MTPGRLQQSTGRCLVRGGKPRVRSVDQITASVAAFGPNWIQSHSLVLLAKMGTRADSMVSVAFAARPTLGRSCE